MLTAAQLTGRTTSHLEALPDAPQVLLQAPVAAAFTAMQKAAASAGIEVAVASSFRDFDRQLSIWNRKFYGELPIYNDRGEQLATEHLSSGEKVEAILLYSALPGASRHHWGTDLDVYDPRPFAAHESKLQLVANEYQEGGPCYSMWQWLQSHAQEFGFFFPYARYQGGVAAEPWHISHVECAAAAQQQLSNELLRQVITEADIAGKSYILAQLTELKQRYVDTICSPEVTGASAWFG